MYANKNNDMAVSPIVATLVLIVVAVIGAVAVGTIMGTFSTDVSKQTNAGQASGASQTEIIVAGSTTVDPVTQAIAKIYNKENPGVKISSQATGSGAGFQAVTLGVADIGAMSEAPSTTQLAQNPNAQVYRIGSGAVAVITNKASPAVVAAALPGGATPLTVADLSGIYTAVPAPTAAFNAGAIPVTRSDSSGTADTFFQKFLGKGTTLKSFTSTGVAQSGNAALVQYVGTTANTIGFCDFGYVATRSDVVILPLDDGIRSYVGINYANLTVAAQNEYRNNVEKTQSKAQSSVAEYNLTLIHPLNYITNGNPSTLQNAFINFARSGDASQGFIDTNTFPLSKIF